MTLCRLHILRACVEAGGRHRIYLTRVFFQVWIFIQDNKISSYIAAVVKDGILYRVLANFSAFSDYQMYKLIYLLDICENDQIK